MRSKLYFPVFQTTSYPKRYLVGYHFIGKNGKKYTTIKWIERKKKKKKTN